MLLAAAATTLLMTAACNAQSPGTRAASSQPNSLTMLSFSYDPVLKSYSQALDPLEQKTGVKVTVHSTGSSSYEDVAQKLASSITAGNAPDIAAVGTNDVARFAQEGVAQPLDDQLAGDQEFVKTNFESSLLDADKVDGKQYAIPYSVSTMIMMYNKDAFTKAGLDPNNPPRTFSELKADAQALVQSGAVKTGTNYATDTSGNWNFQNYLFSAGGSMMDPGQKNITFNGQQGQDVLTFWRSMVSSGLAVAGKEADAVDRFTRGDLGILIDSGAQLTNVAPKIGFGLGAAQFPVPDGGTRAVAPGGSSLIVVTKDKARQAAAWKVIRALTGPEGSTALTTNTGYTPVSKLAINGNDYLAPLLAQQPLRKVSIQASTQMVPWFQFPGRNAVEISTGLSNEITAILRGEETPKQGLDKAADQAKGLLP
ncbi:ABC transporter substrate-binding protein [Nocardia sp. NPDC004711]